MSRRQQHDTEEEATGTHPSLARDRISLDDRDQSTLDHRDRSHRLPDYAD